MSSTTSSRSRVLLVLCATLAIASVASADSTAAAVAAFGNGLNAQLASGSYEFRLDKAEYLTDGTAIGQTVYFNNRGNKQIPVHYVPGDPRRGGGTNITYTIDQTEGAVDALSQAQTNAAIDRAMATWDNVQCSTIPIDAVANPGTDLGIVEFLTGMGGSPFFFADITHAGWLPGGTLPPNVIAVTFHFVWVDGFGNPTDINNDNNEDTAFTEIYYHDAFTWQIDADIDVETIALHEAGHALSQDHFGKGFETDANGKFHISPQAVMNATYNGVLQSLTGTDKGGHCSIWGSWPNQ